jgi:hypothetical protein
MSYEAFQNKVSSEKLTLATLNASKRLMGWTLHSGSIYKIENFDVQVVESIEDSGTAYTEVQDIGDCTASKFYNDRENKIIYLRTTGSDNPNGRFIALTFKLFFASGPITLPHDLASGVEVLWEGTIKSTSTFGVEIDFVNQTSEAIEGSGTLTLVNDNIFWPANFDKLAFENNVCNIYSFSRGLDPSEAKILFSGYVDKKTYSSSQIQFSLKDLLSNLKDPIQLSNIEELGLRNSSDLNKAKQRMILGRVYGHRPVNLDEVLDGYPLTGTLTVNVGSETVTGTGTAFLAELSPDDKIVLGDEEYTIATITSDTSLTITELFTGTAAVSDATSKVLPDRPKRYMNREWLVSGHALRQPTTTTEAYCTITRITVGSTADMYAGDWIIIGSEQVRIDSILSSRLLILATSLITPPVAGVSVVKPAIQRVRLDDVLLRYDTDYSFDADSGVLTLENSAEANSSPLKKLTSNLTFTNTSRTVTGTNFKTIMRPGYMVGCDGHEEMFEVLSVDSDTSLSLRTASTFTDTDLGLYKDYIFDPDNSVLTCEVLGRTDDGTTSGNLLDTAPKIIRQFLVDMGLTSMINEDSFTLATQLSQEPVGMVIPSKYDDTDTLTYRDVFNKINPSVFGSLIQDTDLLLSYLILQPRKSSSSLRLYESDVIDLKLSSASDKVIKTAIVYYRPREYDYLTKTEAINTKQKTSDNAQYLLRVKREKTFDTVLVEESDAERHAGRWSLILESSSGSIDIKTKLQAINLEIGSIVDITHRKLYERFGANSKRKLGLVESVKKNGTDVEVSLVDLSNTFNTVGSINSLTTDWATTDEEGRIYGGFITDDYGLIDNEPDSFGTNKIW